jgi:hypothetical protein
MKSNFNNLIMRNIAFVFCLFTLSLNSFAAEVETPVTCVEGAEPLALAYGNSTSGCGISPAVDTDTFTFSGVINDQVRINVFSTSTNMDPVLEVRDSMGTIIATDSCINIGCTFSLDFVLPNTGLYLLTVFDAGSNEAGNYTLQLEKIFPATNLLRIDYDTETIDNISPATDIDHYYFNADPGTSVRLNVFSTSTNMDPTIELRDPLGGMVLNGAIDGASCTNIGCTFSVEVSPTMSGNYSLLIYDAVNNEAGAYQLSLWCITGQCDSDGVGGPDAAAPILSYFSPVIDTLSPAVDADFYRLNAAAGTTIRLNAFSTSTNMDPTIELRDPSGSLVLDGAVDGASCNNIGCTFSVEVTPVFNGFYSLIIYDSLTNEAGSYQLSLWCVTGVCDSDGVNGPDPASPVLSYIVPVAETISPAVEADKYTFNATAGSSIRINLFSTSTNMDPTIEVRDPNDSIILNGAADAASCNNIGCTFSVDLIPALSGSYSLLLYDLVTNEAGSYQISLWCVQGDCDSDADGVIDGDLEVINYGDTKVNNISPAVDGDFYVFMGTAGDQIRFNVFSTSTNMDPTIEVYDPNGVRVLNGAADGASCNNIGCTFSVDFTPAFTGTHIIMLYDRVTNEAGAYQLGLQCVFSPGDFICNDSSVPLPSCDNCGVVANASQFDSNGDGLGNACDADLNDDGLVNFADLSAFRICFKTTDPNCDFNASGGIVNFADLAIFRNLFNKVPGPTCSAPNTP